MYLQVLKKLKHLYFHLILRQISPITSAHMLATFDAFFEGDTGKPTNVEKDLYLTQEENEMFQYLKTNNLRLEQEKIPYAYAYQRIPK